MASNSIENLFKNFWDWRLKEFPEFATFVGVHSYDDKLQSYNATVVEKRMLAVEEFLKEAELLLSDPNTKSDEMLNLMYFTSDLNVFLKGVSQKGYFFPISYLDGVHIEFERLLETMKKETEEDFQKIISRLSLLPNQISEVIELLKDGVKNKMTFHLISVAGILTQLDLLQKNPEETIFFKPFTTIADNNSISISSKSELNAKALNIIKECVLPSFKNLRDFLKNEYFKHLRPEIAITSLHHGKQFYQSCLDYHLSCSMTPEEVHETGLQEVERIRKKMEEIIESLELNKTLKQFSDHMRKQTDFCFENEEELLESYKGALFNSIEPKLPQIFNYKPKSKIVIKPMPSSSPNAPVAYYYAGTLDGSKPGSFLINTTDLKALPKYDVMTLTLHEAMPGHHLQASYMIESENMPEFRRFLEDRRYTEAPSLFPLHTAYVEGWGLYSEHLGYELGLYDDVYLEYAHLSYEMLRACRLVVDTGIHVFGWTKERAAYYMLEHTAAHRREIENELNRYITWPGQACGYKIGELKIKALRQQAEKELGPKFDIRKFHDIVLQSFGPLDLLEKRVKDYILCSSS